MFFFSFSEAAFRTCGLKYIFVECCVLLKRRQVMIEYPASRTLLSGGSKEVLLAG